MQQNITKSISNNNTEPYKNKCTAKPIIQRIKLGINIDKINKKLAAANKS